MAGFALLRLVVQNLIDSLTNGHLTNLEKTLKDLMAELATDLNDKLELQDERIQHLER